MEQPPVKPALKEETLHYVSFVGNDSGFLDNFPLIWCLEDELFLLFSHPATKASSLLFLLQHKDIKYSVEKRSFYSSFTISSVLAAVSVTVYF